MFRLVVYVISCYGRSECAYEFFFFFQAEDGIRDLVRSRGLGDVYKRQALGYVVEARLIGAAVLAKLPTLPGLDLLCPAHLLSLIHI